MLYPYIILADETQILHTHVFEEDGVMKVLVHFERPTENGFLSARIELPSYKWLYNEGFSPEELKNFEDLAKRHAHLFYRFGASGGIQLA